MTDLEHATAWWEKYFSHWPEDDAEIETLAAEFAAVRREALEECAEKFGLWHCLDHGGEEQDEIWARIKSLISSGGGGGGK